jgi:hypothetical protein
VRKILPVVLLALVCSVRAAAQPTIRVADADVVEGNGGGLTTLTFTVTLSAPPVTGPSISVDYAVRGTPLPRPTAAEGTQCSGATDFLSSAGTLTFPPLMPIQRITVSVCADAYFELDDELTVTLSAPRGATIQRGTALGVIRNDDPQPQITVSAPAAVPEGNSGATQVSVRLSLSHPFHGGTRVTLRPQGTATRVAAACSGAADFQAPDSVRVSWPANNADLWTITWTVCGDTRDEPDEVIEIRFTDLVTGALATASPVRVTITDDDPPPGLSLADTVVAPPANSSSKVVRFLPRLDVVSDRDVEITLTAQVPTSPHPSNIPGMSARAACGTSDAFIPTSQRLTIPAGSRQPTSGMPVTICGGVVSMGGKAATLGETFQITATAPSNAVIVRSPAWVVVR